MSIVKVSENAFKEFKKFLEENDVKTDVIRIHLAGMGCGGPAFNLVLDEKKEEDNVEVMDGLTFLVDKNVTEQFGELSLLCADENGMGGFSIETEKRVEGGCCSGCSGCGE